LIFNSDEQERVQLEAVVSEHYRGPAMDICNALPQHALKDGDYLRENNETDRIDDKTVFTVKGT
jgi:hypothetical protein